MLALFIRDRGLALYGGRLEESLPDDDIQKSKNALTCIDDIFSWSNNVLLQMLRC